MSMTVKWYGAKAKASERRGAARGLRLGAFHVEEESRRLVSIEEGTLQRQTIVSVDEAALRAAVSYDTPYAVRQHEELSYQHDAGRKAKYLEDTINSPSVAQRVRWLVTHEIRKELGTVGS